MEEDGVGEVCGGEEEEVLSFVRKANRNEQNVEIVAKLIYIGFS